MADRPSSTRREFLSGKAAVDSLGNLVDAAADAAPPLSLSDSYLIHFGRRAMACQFEVFLNAGQYPEATSAALAALDLIDGLEAQMTAYQETSEISQINRLAAEGPVLVEPQLLELLRYALQLHAETAGAYDITSGPLSKVWGFFRRQGQLPDNAALEQTLALVGSQHVEIDAAGQTIRFQRAGMELNLGSIGKGYALDRAADVLTKAGIGDFFWHGGQSSILARGSRAGSEGGWLVSLGDPLRPGKQLMQLRLQNRAMGTSGAGTQFFRHEGRRYGHILDPRTGWPAEGVYSASALAPTAAQADALATAFYVMGPEATLEYCGRHPDIAAVMVCPAEGRSGLEIITAGRADGELLDGTD